MAGPNGPTSQNLSTFRETGVLRLPNAIDEAVLATLKGHFWDQVGETFAISEHDADTWFANPHNPAGDSRGRRLSAMNPVMNSLRSADRLAAAESSIRAAIDDLFGPDRWKPLDKWYSLLSFPGSEQAWTVPRNSWHNDEPIVVGDHEPWSIFVFVFLDSVERTTGPTLAITGSHRRGEIIATEHAVRDESQVRAFDRGLISEPGNVRLLPVGQLLPALTSTDAWFRELVEADSSGDREQRMVGAGTKRGDIESRVVDLIGDAGDIVLFDPRCLHTFSANVSTRPRQVLRLDFLRTTLQ